MENIYAPDFNSLDLMNRLSSTLRLLHTQILILVGAVNCVLNPSLDHSNPPTLFLSSISSNLDFMPKNVFCRSLQDLNYIVFLSSLMFTNLIPHGLFI